VLRGIVRALAVLVFAVAALVVLEFAEILVPVEPDNSSAMADTIPGCDARVLAQGLTYRLWADPEPGHIVTVHAAVNAGGRIIPDRDADDRTLVLRVVGGPGDVVDVRDGTVYVNDVRFDELETEPFEPVTVPNEQYFLLGDNRSAAIDSRTFGPVLGNAIFARVFAVFWPLREVTFRFDRDSGPPPGRISCT
jgi:signal peptidase I